MNRILHNWLEEEHDILYESMLDDNLNKEDFNERIEMVNAIRNEFGDEPITYGEYQEEASE